MRKRRTKGTIRLFIEWRVAKDEGRKKKKKAISQTDI
jgi:hypothetical protein